MPKIDTDGFFNTARSGSGGGSRNTQSVAPHQVKFDNLLQNTQRTQYEQRDDERNRRSLEDLFAEITKKGKTLKNDLTWSSILAYKNSVRFFLSKIQQQMLTTKIEKSHAHSDSQKKYTLIKHINTSLQVMVDSFLSQQDAHLAILAKVGEISGLLIDLRS